MTWEMLVRSNNLNGPDLKWLRGQTAMLTEILFIWLCPGIRVGGVSWLPHEPIMLSHWAFGGVVGGGGGISVRSWWHKTGWNSLKMSFENCTKETKPKHFSTTLIFLFAYNTAVEQSNISCGPLTSDLPLGLCGVEGRSPRVVTACELLTSHWSPPLSLQDAMPPTSATSFFASLGKLGNSLYSRPPRHWWGTIISLHSHPEACTVGCYDGSNHNLTGNLCLITGSGLYILLIINTVAGVLIPPLGLKLMRLLHYKKNHSATKPLGHMFQMSYSYKCLPLYLTITYIYTSVKKCKKNAQSQKKYFLSCLCSIKSCAFSSGNPIYHCLN